jgi:hypothetical protein
VFELLGIVIGVYLGEFVYSKVLNADELPGCNLAHVVYVNPEVGNVGPVEFTTTLLVLVVQSKHFTPLSIVYVAPVNV